MSFTIIFLIKSVYAAFLGFIIGAQREKTGKPAGARTTALVTLGSTAFSLMSSQGFGDSLGLDPSRISSQIVVGVGFLGAGIITFHDDKVNGVTTAATLWVAAALGIVIANGFYFEALYLTLITLFILLLSKVQEKTGWLKN